MRAWQRIVVGYDFRANGETALLSAMALANDTNTTIKLVHVVESYPLYQRLSQPFTVPYSVEDLVQQAGEKLEARLQQTDLASFRVEYEVRTGKPFVELVLAGRAWRADLLVVGGITPDNARLLGSTGIRLVRKAAIPVLVTKQLWTPMTKNFLVPIDFSSPSREAAETALSLAQQMQGRITFLHVVEIPQFYGMDTLPPLEVSPADLQQSWDTFLADLPFAESVSWDIRTVDGRAATTIVREAASLPTDAIIMGTHGATSLSYMLIGSVAEEVVFSSPCSVLTIRPSGFRVELL